MICLEQPQLKQVERFNRLWLLYKGMPFPDCAYSESVKIEGDMLIANFASNYSEYEFMARGRDFQVYKNHLVPMHSYIFTVRNKRLYHPAIDGRFRVKKEDVFNSGIKAYAQMGGEIHTLSIVNEITGASQIQIESESNVILSDNLSNASIEVRRCPVLFNRCVLSNGNEIIDPFSVHFITIEEQATYYGEIQSYLVPFDDWSKELDKAVRTFTFKTNPSTLVISKIE